MHMTSNQSDAKGKSAGRLIWVGILVVGLGSIGVFVYRHKSTPASENAPVVSVQESPPEAPQEPVDQAPAPVVAEASTKKAAKAPNNAVVTPIQPTVSHTDPTPLTRQLVGLLAKPDLSAMTAEQAVQWKYNLSQLVQQGPAGVGAIREFLSQSVDMDFGGAGRALGYSSARVAMFDALQQIGGPEAVSAMTGVLQTTADPKEIALLARNLAQQDPELYRGEVLNAVHEALTMAASKNLEGSDVGPLFEVLQKYGGVTAVTDLEQVANQWKYYATMALAKLPDGAGVPSLIRMAQGTTGGRDAALEMLAQLAATNPDARAALLEQTRSDKISAGFWPGLTAPLSGDQFQVKDSVIDGSTNLITNNGLRTTHINYGNQNFISAPVTMTPDQISQQIVLVDEMLAVASNPSAIKALQEAKGALSQKLAQSTVVSKGQ
jgi:hypothetical protein